MISQLQDRQREQEMQKTRKEKELSEMRASISKTSDTQEEHLKEMLQKETSKQKEAWQAEL